MPDDGNLPPSFGREGRSAPETRVDDSEAVHEARLAHPGTYSWPFASRRPFSGGGAPGASPSAVGADRFRQLLLAGLDLLGDLGPVAIGLGRLDQDPTGVAVAALGEAAEPAALAARVLAGGGRPR